MTVGAPAPGHWALVIYWSLGFGDWSFLRLAPAAQRECRQGQGGEGQGRRFGDGGDGDVVEGDGLVGAVAVDYQAEAEEVLAGGDVEALGGECLRHRAGEHLPGGELGAGQLELLGGPEVLRVVPAAGVDVGAQLHEGAGAGAERP